VRAGLLSLVIAAALLAAAPASAAIRVVAATTDLAALTAAVGGDIIIAESIVPAGVDAEAFEPRPGDLDKLRQADLIVRIGLGYDYWLDALVARIGDKRIMRGGDAYVDASAGIPLLEIRGQSVVNEGGHSHGVGNPHYWLDPENAIIVSAGIAEALVRRAPAHRDRIVANRERFLAELRMRLQKWSEALAPYAGAKFIAYHNSWPYFARRFRLDVVGYIEPKEGVAPSPAHLARLISLGRTSQVKAILHEPYEPEEASRFVAQKLGVPMLRLAISVGSLPDARDYFALFDYNVASIANALRAQKP
jgi:ABC-type Zn uptake system ZnuABC Zn-binding protein ZnuA